MSQQEFTKVICVGRSAYGRIFCKIEYKDHRLSICGVVGPTSDGNARGSVGQINLLDHELVEHYAGWDPQKIVRFQRIWDRWHLNYMRANCEHQRSNWGEPARMVKLKLRGVKWESWRQLQKQIDVDSRARGGFTPDAENPNDLERMVEYSSAARILLALNKMKIEPFGTRHVSDKDLQDAVEKLLPNEQEFFRTAIETRVDAKAIGWLRQDEHPEGILSKPCEECGYAYGSKWLSEEVPSHVLDYLRNLPDSEFQPAWV